MLYVYIYIFQICIWDEFAKATKGVIFL